MDEDLQINIPQFTCLSEEYQTDTKISLRHFGHLLQHEYQAYYW